MKGIIGRKVGMSQVFTDAGRSLPVTIIEVKPNVVTSILTNEKNGYDAIQLAVDDKKKSTYKKPELGHFKKANTNPKRMVREFKGTTTYKLGDQVKVDIFQPGELVDVIGRSKGKGFAGAIKRHNQHIGPKGHGGGGGSQPVRQTGSLGDISGNKVVKGMTMPGHMGTMRSTVQNLEVILTNLSKNLLVVKGSIPGPNKGFVLIREAVKGLPNKEAVTLVNVEETILKNQLLEAAKKVGADVNTEMSIDEMQLAIEATKTAKQAAEEAAKAAQEAAKLKEEAAKTKAKTEELREEAQKAAASGDQSAAQEAQTQAVILEKQAQKVEAKAQEAQDEAQEAQVEAQKAEATADELQVESEPQVVEETEDKGGK